MEDSKKTEFRTDKYHKAQKEREKPEFEQKLVDLARVTRVMAGGKRMRFRACVVIGDLNGRIGWGLAKGADVSLAINKAVNQAKKRMITFTSYKNTIRHEIFIKFKSAKVYLKPAPEGRGIIAGGVVRDVLEMAGIKDVIAKIYGGKNKVNNVKAVFKALQRIKVVEESTQGVSTDKEEVKEDKTKKEVKE